MHNLNLSSYTRIDSIEEWWRFVRCANKALALKYKREYLPEEFPCLMYRHEAEPDWGPGAPDRYHIIQRSDAREILDTLK